MTIVKSVLLISFLVLTFLFSSCGIFESDKPESDVEICVMTRNIYVGADLDTIMSIETPEEIPVVVAAVWAEIQSTLFSERVQALADEIAEKEPDLIGLQEVSLIRLQSPGDTAVGGAVPATDIIASYIDSLLAQLADRRLDYTSVASVINFDIEVPMATGPDTFDDIRLTDHDVILARSDLSVSNAQGARYATNAANYPGSTELTLFRGWVSVDVELDGKTFRFVSTHLESADISPAVQENQAIELLEQLSTTDLPVILVGDFNSDADGSTTDTYEILTGAGFEDAWIEANPHDLGLTCCQLLSLLNTSSILDLRIDLILFIDDFKVVDAVLTGASPSDITSSGLWPSDHAGVVATLILP